MKKINIYLILTITLVLSACIKEDFFGQSSYAEIKDFKVSEQSGQNQINSSNKTIIVPIPSGIDLSGIELQELSMSTFAEADIQVGDLLDLRDSSIINVRAENQSISQWIIKAVVASEQPQLNNSDFNLWYESSAGYLEPGEDGTNTIWGTGNPGGAILNKIATTSYDMGNDNFAAKLETLDNGFLGQLAGTPITTATIYTGKFNRDNIDLDNPRAAIDFGALFTARPTGFSFKYTYTPGSVNKDRRGNVLDYGDKMDVYVFLEVREGETSKRLATGLFRSGETVENMTTESVDLIYGELHDSFPLELLPEDGFVPDTEIDYALPTHIVFLATSSYQGDKFEGAVGSTLLIDDLELRYE